MTIPEFFARELKTIDPTYRVQECEDGDGYHIIKDVDLTFKLDGGKTLTSPRTARARGPLVVLFAQHLDARTLDQLREMKYRALELGIYDNPVNELAFWKAQQKKAKEKRRDIAVDIVTEGIMEMHKLATSKSWSYGGEPPKEK